MGETTQLADQSASCQRFFLLICESKNLTKKLKHPNLMIEMIHCLKALDLLFEKLKFKFKCSRTSGRAQVTVSLDSFLSLFSPTRWTVTGINKVRVQCLAQSRLTSLKPQHTCPCPIRSHGWSWGRQVERLNLEMCLICWAFINSSRNNMAGC